MCLTINDHRTKFFLTKNISDLVTVRNSFQHQMYNKLSNLKSILKAITGLRKAISKFWSQWKFQVDDFFCKASNYMPLRLYNFAKVFRFNKPFNFSFEFLIKKSYIDAYCNVITYWHCNYIQLCSISKLSSIKLFGYYWSSTVLSHY